jgi:hypothetical protein
MVRPLRSLAVLACAGALVAVAGCKSPGSHAALPAAHSSIASVTTAPSVPATVTRSPTPSATHPTHATTAPVHVSIRPSLVHVTILPAIRGDLTIGLARPDDCTWYVATDGLWINPVLLVHWTGVPVAPATVSFNMTTNYGKHTAGGALQPNVAHQWAIGGEAVSGNSWLGHTVIITVTVDPTLEVTESNESNNTATITLNVPATAPADFAEHPIACS